MDILARLLAGVHPRNLFGTLRLSSYLKAQSSCTARFTHRQLAQGALRRVGFGLTITWLGHKGGVVRRVAGALAALVGATVVNLTTGHAVAPTTTTGAFGGTVPGASIDTPGAGYKFGSVYALSSTATLKDFKWYAGGGSSTQSFVSATDLQH
jgi:hypothetical protein